MKMLPLFFVLFSTFVVAEDPNPWLWKEVPQLILENGKIYKKVTFTRIDPDTISIRHEGGIVTLAMESLTSDSRIALGYDADKAASARIARSQSIQEAAIKAEETNWYNQFTVTHDAFQNCDFVKHQRSMESDRTGISAYIAVPSGHPEKATLKLLVTYRGEDWIFMDRIIFAGGDSPVTYELDREGDIPDYPLPLHEWAHLNIDDPLKFEKVITEAKAFRLAGKFVKDVEFDQKMWNPIAETFLLYAKMVKIH